MIRDWAELRPGQLPGSFPTRWHSRAVRLHLSRIAHFFPSPGKRRTAELFPEAEGVVIAVERASVEAVRAVAYATKQVRPARWPRQSLSGDQPRGRLVRPRQSGMSGRGPSCMSQSARLAE